MKTRINKLIGLAVLLPASVLAADLPVYKLSIKEHRFSPAKLLVPPGVKFKLVVKNEDAEPAEFESFALHREQVVVGKAEGAVFLGPLKAGRYEFFDDFHAAAKGVLEAAVAAEKR